MRGAHSESVCPVKTTSELATGLALDAIDNAHRQSSNMRRQMLELQETNSKLEAKNVNLQLENNNLKQRVEQLNEDLRASDHRYVQSLGSIDL